MDSSTIEFPIQAATNVKCAKLDNGKSLPDDAETMTGDQSCSLL